MNPVHGSAMINFIEWIFRYRPHIKSLKSLHEDELMQLVNEFEGGKLTGNWKLTEKWKSGFHFCFQGSGSMDSYDIARKVLANFEGSRIHKSYKGVFERFGITEKDDRPLADYVDRRYIVPLRAMFLFSSEDRLIEEYVKRNYNALDSLSGQFCDIYFSTDQLFHKENAYNQLNDIHIFQQLPQPAFNQLPGIIFWDGQYNSEYITLVDESDDSMITKKLRSVFSMIRVAPQIDSVKEFNRLNPPQNKITLQKILFTSANPKSTGQLRIDEEVREIENGLRGAKDRDYFVFKPILATRISDFYRAMLDFNPTIVHFSGHGEEDGILMEDEIGNYTIVSDAALGGLFELFKDRVICIVLNSCFSRHQALAITNHIKYVIGMNNSINDKTAIKFATSFYDALGSGRDVEFAFKFALTAIKLYGLPGSEIPELFIRSF